MYKKLIQPKVSVVICNYNYAHYIDYAIDSVLAQTYSAHELIVVDDGSTDDSLTVVKQFGEQVKLVAKPNGGQVSAYNAAMAHITGDVVLFLDADDALMPNALSLIATGFAEKVVKVHFKLAFMNQHGHEMPHFVPRVLDSGDCAKDLIKYGLLYNSAPASGNVYRVAALQNLFPLPILANDKHGADFYCIYGIVFEGLVHSIDQPLGKYRVHHSTASTDIAYGNSLKGLDLARTLNSRWYAFKAWVESKGIANATLPKEYIDFSQQKVLFCDAVLKVNSVTNWFKTAATDYPNIIKSILLRKDFKLLIKCFLIIWATVIQVSPNRLKRYLAQKVCNPLKS